MMKLVECIPNFSVSRERDEAAFNALVDTAKAVPGCTVLDVQSDGTHNRCVFTLVGSPEGIGEAAFRLAKRAMEVIDLTKHQGAHPRMGATDVIPFVPTMDMTVQECVELSKQVAGRIWDELRIPSFLYEDSATSPDRVNLAKIRKGQFEAREAPAAGVGPGFWRKEGPPHCRDHRHRRTDAAGGLQREPGHGQRGDRKVHRQGHPRLLRRVQILQGHRPAAGGPERGPGVHEYGEL